LDREMWAEAGLNVSAVVLRKGRGLNELNDWQCEVCRFTGKS